MAETIVSIIVVSALLVTVLATSRFIGLDPRVTIFSLVLTIATGLASFSALSSLAQAFGVVSSLSPGEQLAIMPIALVAQLLVGAYVGSRMSGLSYAKSLGSTVAILGLVAAISVPLILLVFTGR